jgi:vacuolar-type H+-ATPase subunit B/Vma2
VASSRAVVQVFEGTSTIDKWQTKYSFPKVLPGAYVGINSISNNPSSHNYLEAMIQTGISAIDTMNATARG